MFAATIDGFVLAALLTSLSLSLQGDRSAAPWAVRVLAVTAAAISLVFNLQHVPAGMARWGAAVPPVAVLTGLEVLLLQVRRAVHRQDATAPVPPLTPAQAQAGGVGWHAAESSSQTLRPYQSAVPARPRPNCIRRMRHRNQSILKRERGRLCRLASRKSLPQTRQPGSRPVSSTTSRLPPGSA